MVMFCCYFWFEENGTDHGLLRDTVPQLLRIEMVFHGRYGKIQNRNYKGHFCKIYLLIAVCVSFYTAGTGKLECQIGPPFQ